MRVCRADARLRTIVGPGLVVVLCRGKGRGGGLLHLPFQTVSPMPDLLAVHERWQRFVQEFSGRTIRGAKGHLAGAADLLQMIPESALTRRAEACHATLVALLMQSGAELVGADLGGRFGRSVEVDLATGQCDVRVTTQRRREAKRRGENEQIAALLPPPSAPPGPDGTRGAIVSVPMGELRVTQSPGSLSVVLGSCVGVAVYDPQSKIGALAHVVMPRAPADVGMNARGRYADKAVDALIDTLREAGAEVGTLQGRLAGGASILFASERDLFRVAKENVRIARHVLADKGITVVGEDVGGQLGRKVVFDLRDFGMHVKLLSDYGRNT